MYFLLLTLLLFQSPTEVLVFQFVLIVKLLFPFLLIFKKENCIQTVGKNPKINSSFFILTITCIRLQRK